MVVSAEPFRNKTSTAKISGRNLIPVGRLTPFSQHDYEAISIAGHGPSRGARDSAETGPRVAFTSGGDLKWEGRT